MNWWNFKTKHDLTLFLKVTITSVVLCTFRIDPVESATYIHTYIHTDRPTELEYYIRYNFSLSFKSIDSICKKVSYV